MGKESTRQRNEQYRNKRYKLVREFGGCCRYCGVPDECLGFHVDSQKLEFCHKVGHRVYGNNRGRNSRIQEVVNKGKEAFWLGCRSCHHKYDYDHPLTKEEIAMQKIIDQEVPF